MFIINQSRPSVVRSRIIGNHGVGVEMWIPTGSRTVRHSMPTFLNCLVAGNHGVGVVGGRPWLTNCTVVENLAAGLNTLGAIVTNSIIYFNDSDGVQIGDNRAELTYSNVQGGWPGEGNIDADPLFVSSGQWSDSVWTAGDYHLQSQGARWDDVADLWRSDAGTSPCIDAGDPGVSILDEPVALDGAVVGNSRINMGAYGGTAQASVAAD